MKIQGVFETVLYAEDLSAAKRFYQDILQLQLHMEDELFLVFRMKASVLLIFDPRESEQPGRDVPSHGCRGEGHLAFQADEAEYAYWKQRLQDHGVAIEAEVDWPKINRRSLYFRDPAGNSLEFAPRSLWFG